MSALQVAVLLLYAAKPGGIAYFGLAASVMELAMSSLQETLQPAYAAASNTLMNFAVAPSC